MSEWFETFITGVVKQKNKGDIINAYEIGFSKLATEKGMRFKSAVTLRPGDPSTHNGVKHCFRRGLPFIKKKSFSYRNGVLGRQLRYVLNSISPEMRAVVIKDAEYLYGEKYVENLLTGSALKIVWRKFKHAIRPRKHKKAKQIP